MCRTKQTWFRLSQTSAAIFCRYSCCDFQVVSGTFRVNALLQSLANSGKLCASDLKDIWDPGFAMGSAGHWARRRERLVRLVLNMHAASFLIGRGGKRVKLMQEDSGAGIRFWQGVEAPSGLLPHERLMEIRGEDCDR